MAARATLALKPGVWFRRGRLVMVSPDSLGTACPLSGRNSTYRLVQILEAGSHRACAFLSAFLNCALGADYFTRILPLWRMRNIVCAVQQNGLLIDPLSVAACRAVRT